MTDTIRETFQEHTKQVVKMYQEHLATMMKQAEEHHQIIVASYDKTLETFKIVTERCAEMLHICDEINDWVTENVEDAHMQYMASEYLRHRVALRAYLRTTSSNDE
jgi:hypothetical protein